MTDSIKLTGYFAGALFSAQELLGNRILAAEIGRTSGGVVQVDVPQDLSTQETGDGREVRSADYLGMIHRDFVLANLNGPELDSGTVAEYVVASMLGMPRVQFRTDFRNVGDVQTGSPEQITICKTADVPYNLMLGHDESALVFIHSMSLYKSTNSLDAFLEKTARAVLDGIKLAYQLRTAGPDEYAAQQLALCRYLNLDPIAVAEILRAKQERHRGEGYRQAVAQLLAL